MSYEISILLNYFVVFIEAVGFIVFSGAFFEQKINICKFILSVVILTGLNFICLTVSESNVFFKLILLTCTDSLYLIVIRRIPLHIFLCTIARENESSFLSGGWTIRPF